MEYTYLRNTDIKVSRLCMGGCPMGEYGWGKVDQQELLEAVHTALDCGITFFDTADTYGLGRSEENLGKGLGNRRKDVVIGTKFGVRVENGKTFYDNSPAWIEEALTRSLKRLNTDYIDCYQLHYLDGKTPMDEVVDTLEGLKKKGMIRAYGLSNIHQDDFEALLPYAGSFSCMQDEYSLACRKYEEDLRFAASDLKVTPMTWGSLGQGILTGKYDQNCSFDYNDRRSREIYVNFHGEKLLNNLRIVEAMREMAEKQGVAVSAVAIRFTLDYLPNSVVLVGAKRPAQVMKNLEAMDWHLTEEELALLDQVSR